MENTVFLRGLARNMNFCVFMKVFEDKCYTKTKCFWTLLYSAPLAFNSINIYWKPVSQKLCWPWGYKDDFEGHESSTKWWHETEILGKQWNLRWGFGAFILPLALYFPGSPSEKAVDTRTGAEWENGVPLYHDWSSAQYPQMQGFSGRTLARWPMWGLPNPVPSHLHLRSRDTYPVSLMHEKLKTACVDGTAGPGGKCCPSHVPTT